MNDLALQAIIWDILTYIPDDIVIMRRSPIRLVTICFITTRLVAMITRNTR